MTKRMLVAIIIGVTVLSIWTVIIINESSASGSTTPSTTASPVTTTAPTPTFTVEPPPPTTSIPEPPTTQPVATPTTQAASSTQPTDGCWMDLARQVGWPEETLGHLNYIIQRESRCDPSAYANRPSTMDNSRGLLQINSYGSLDGVVRRLCGIDPTELFDPTTNLTCGLAYYRNAGWSPWGG